MNIRFEFLGKQKIIVQQSRITLPNKAYLLLAYLMLEGQTAKRDLAELFWSGAADGLNSLSKLKNEIVRVLGQEIILVDGKMMWLAEVEADLIEWQTADTVRRWLLYKGELLQGFRLPEWERGCGVDLYEWLEQQRQILAVEHFSAGVELCRQQLYLGDYKSGLMYLPTLVIDNNQTNERIIRWWFWTLGALQKQDCLPSAAKSAKLALHKALDIDFSAATQKAYNLASQSSYGCISALQDELGTPTFERVGLPLIGREHVWQRMEAAWQAGQAILLSGDSGVGKSRLALEFVRAKGKYWRFWGRPSDEFVPYAFHARSFGWMFEHYPGLNVPDWVRDEMTRLIPKLAGQPTEIRSDADQLRFYEAQAETFWLACQQFEFETMLVEDVHLCDQASSQAGVYLHSKLLPYQSNSPRTIFTFQQGQLRPEIERSLRVWVQQGVAIWIDLEPLNETMVEVFVQYLAPTLQPLHTQIMALSGGNPFAIMEVVHLLLEQPEFLKSPFAKTPRIFEFIQARLQHLSTLELQLLRLAVLLDEQFSVQTAQMVLGWTRFEVEKYLFNLQKAHMMRHEKVVHDLIAQAVLQAIPTTLRLNLHRQIYSCLKSLGSPQEILLFHAQAAARNTS
jgi:hypothetical protein